MQMSLVRQVAYNTQYYVNMLRVEIPADIAESMQNRKGIGGVCVCVGRGGVLS